MATVLGETWQNVDHPLGRVITREYVTNIDGQTVKWIEFGGPAWTYVYDELSERGWVLVPPPEETP